MHSVTTGEKETKLKGRIKFGCLGINLLALLGTEKKKKSLDDGKKKPQKPFETHFQSR
jgi:hypothetical protein